VLTKFGRYAKRQLGCIKFADEKSKVKSLLKKYKEDISSQDISSVSIIVLTGYFKDLIVPEFVLISTISHEICHYAHGFNSPLPKKYKYPHRGGVVRKEMVNRGLLKIFIESEDWLKENWQSIVEKSY
jgi:hypothetical protein